MSLDRSDRCPTCGSPYMSTLAPGEVDNRVCYSCNTTAAAPDLSAPADDDLTIQPLEGGTSGLHQAPRGNVRRQMERQIRSSGVRAGVTSKPNLQAVRKSVSNATMPVARGPGSTASMPAVKPANRSTQVMPAVRSAGSTRINIPPAEQIDPNEVQLADGEPEAAAAVANEIPLEAPRVSSARMQAARSSARHRSVQTEKSASPLVWVGVGAAVLVAGAAIYFALGSNPPANTDSVAVAPKFQTAAPAAPIIPPTIAAPEIAIPAKPQAVETPKPAAPEAADATLRIEKSNKAAAPDEVVIAPSAAAPAEEKRDVNKDLFGPKRAANAKLDDEEAMVEAGVTKPAKPSAAMAKDEAPAAGGKKPDALAGMGITGVSSKVKPDEAVPVFDDIRKAKPIIPVTATEPTIVKEDLSLGDQNPEKAFSRSIQSTFPGWKVRDVTLEISQLTSAEHRGKKDVLILNPLNDTLPSKMMATFEIPKEYAGKRPMLVFEVSTKDKASDWFLAVKCMNIDMRPKSIVKCPDEAKWQPVGIDLSALAGKRFDLEIDAYMTPKTNAKKYKEEKAYIRNVQLIWQGKK